VTSQGGRISGNWTEASRNIFGKFAGHGRRWRRSKCSSKPTDLRPTSPATTGNKQTVQINSKGEIRGVKLTMVKG